MISATVHRPLSHSWQLRNVMVLRYNRADSMLVPRQWEMLLQSNTASHWLGTNLESALIWHLVAWSWLVQTAPTSSAPHHCTKQRWLVINLIMWKIFQWNSLWNSYIFIPENQAGKLKFFGTRPNWAVSYIAYTKFHLPRPVFHSPNQIFTRIAERASASFPAWKCFSKCHLQNCKHVQASISMA